jgi:hypothetical protein
MADQSKEKTLEMRVAELEDKLAKFHVTEDELAAYRKVASLIGAGAAGGEAVTAAGAAPGPAQSVACVVRTCVIRTCIIRTCIITCINECTCGPCAMGGGGVGGGGFGSLGM